MTLPGYATVVRHRWRLIMLSALLGVSLGTAVTSLTRTEYQASVQLFVIATGNGDLAGLNQRGEFAQDRVRSYANIVDSPLVLDPVIRELGLSESAQSLASRIVAHAPANTVLINIDVRDTSPSRAALVANEVARQFAEVTAALEANDGTAVSPVRARIVRPAFAPAEPVQPRPLLNLGLGLLGGLLVGLALATYRELTDTRLKDVARVSATLDAPVLAAIPLDKAMTTDPLVVETRPTTSTAEAFRQLRANIQFVGFDHPLHSIVVTSALPQEGKSTVACNLAIAMSQAGFRVVLVEADLRRPQVLDFLGLERASGLVEAIVGRIDWTEALQQWGPGELFVLGSGSPVPNPSELLSSQRMSDLLEKLEGFADVVILDAPPLLPVADAGVLASISSGTLLVVRNGSTRIGDAEQSLETLSRMNGQVIGAVVNMSSPVNGSPYGYADTGSASSRVRASERTA